jgi:hypothetical protein
MNKKSKNLKHCEECNGSGETIIEKHGCDCPHCLGTGLEEPQKRIMQLEYEIAECRIQEDIHYLNYKIAVEMRDCLAALLQDAVNRQGFTNKTLIGSRKILKEIKKFKEDYE